MMSGSSPRTPSPTLGQIQLDPIGDAASLGERPFGSIGLGRRDRKTHKLEGCSDDIRRKHVRTLPFQRQGFGFEQTLSHHWPHFIH